MSSSELAIRVSNLSKCYNIYDSPRDRLKQFVIPRLQRLSGQTPHQYFREFWALKDVSFEVRRGETVGVIGRNGSGKSTLLQLVCGILTPTNGIVETTGRIAALLELGAGFNPEFTGRENIYMNAALLGLRNQEVDERFDDIAAFADIGEFIEQPVKTYSSGMAVRLAFSVSVCIEPAILIIDEALTVGDFAFQQKCLRRLVELQETGTSVLLVTHDIMLTRNYCGRVVYLEQGGVCNIGDPEIVGESYIKDMLSRQRFGNDYSSVEWRQEKGKFGYGSPLGRFVEFRLAKSSSGSMVFNHGEALSLSLAAEVAVGIRNPELIVQVRDFRGYVLYGIPTNENDLHAEVKDGRVLLSAELELPAMLGPGEYCISLGLVDRHGETITAVIDKVVTALSFSVLGSDKNRFHGAVNLGGSWRLPRKKTGVNGRDG